MKPFRLSESCRLVRGNNRHFILSPPSCTPEMSVGCDGVSAVKKGIASSAPQMSGIMQLFFNSFISLQRWSFLFFVHFLATLKIKKEEVI